MWQEKTIHLNHLPTYFLKLIFIWFIILQMYVCLFSWVQLKKKPVFWESQIEIWYLRPPLSITWNPETKVKRVLLSSLLPHWKISFTETHGGNRNMPMWGALINCRPLWRLQPIYHMGFHLTCSAPSLSLSPLLSLLFMTHYVLIICNLCIWKALLEEVKRTRWIQDTVKVSVQETLTLIV